jgi:RNA polymerase sigma-70 factor (ECF subfamily)
MAYRQDYAAMTDQELVRLFHEGETRGAFTVLVERYQKRIYFAARKMVLGDHDEADEIAQETFVKAYDALKNFRGEAQVYTWLYRIMMNAVIQRSRKKKTRPMIDVTDFTDILESPDTNPHEQMQRSETTRLIEEAIETLPPKQQRVFIMRFYEELPYEEIAAIVGTSVGGLKANYFHAVKKIGDYLKASGKIMGEPASFQAEPLAQADSI